VSVIVRGPVAKGLLADKPPAPYLEHGPEVVAAAREALDRPVGSRRSRAQVALRYYLAHPVVATRPSGASSLPPLEAVGRLEEETGTALQGLVIDLRRAQRDLALSYVRASNGKRLGVNAFLDRYKNLLHRYDQALAEVREQDLLDLTSGGVLVRLLAQATRD